MKTIILSIALMILTILPAAAVKAQSETPVRIQFAKGKSVATVKGTTGNYGVNYVVRARSGQKLVLNLTPGKQVGIRVETNGSNGQTVLLREKRGGTYEVGLEESGDYTIFIGPTANKPASFTLTIQITKMTDI